MGGKKTYQQFFLHITEINKYGNIETAIISSLSVIIRTFGVDDLIWFEITKTAEKLDNDREKE